MTGSVEPVTATIGTHEPAQSVGASYQRFNQQPMFIRKVRSAPIRAVVKARQWLLGNRFISFWLHQRYAEAPIGTPKWLIRQEIRYGGFHTGVRRNRISPVDPRTPWQVKNGGMTGGDRMLVNGYGSIYSRFLKHFLDVAPERLTIVEVGILRGTGLAIWADLFPGSRIIGLDIDLAHFQGNLPHLRELGAFTHGEPEVYEFDQFQDNSIELAEILRGYTADIVVDDGLHSVETILGTLRNMLPFMSERFLYFVEDHRTVHREIVAAHPELNVENFGEMTVISRGLGTVHDPENLRWTSV